VKIQIMGAEVTYFHYPHKGVDFVFVDHPSYPRPGGLYADDHGVYGDNQVSCWYWPARIGFKQVESCLACAMQQWRSVSSRGTAALMGVPSLQAEIAAYNVAHTQRNCCRSLICMPIAVLETKHASWPRHQAAHPACDASGFKNHQAVQLRAH
jgi:hypothetical protein